VAWRKEKNELREILQKCWNKDPIIIQSLRQFWTGCPLPDPVSHDSSSSADSVEAHDVHLEAPVKIFDPVPSVKVRSAFLISTIESLPSEILVDCDLTGLACPEFDTYALLVLGLTGEVPEGTAPPTEDDFEKVCGSIVDLIEASVFDWETKDPFFKTSPISEAFTELFQECPEFEERLERQLDRLPGKRAKEEEVNRNIDRVAFAVELIKVIRSLMLLNWIANQLQLLPEVLPPVFVSPFRLVTDSLLVPFLHSIPSSSSSTLSSDDPQDQDQDDSDSDQKPSSSSSS
jgi:hypothetical protein